MVSQRIERMIAQVRHWRSGDDTEPLPVAPTLPDGDQKRLRKLIDECVSDRGGEIAARRRAKAIGATFLTLDESGRENFFRLLAEDYDHDDDEVDSAIDNVVRARSAGDRRSAEQTLARALQPKRAHLLRRFAGLDGGLPFLVGLREDFLTLDYRNDAALSALDDDLKAVLAGWFDLAMLNLERLTWDTSAALLEKLIDYEAVHAIESWDDLRGRLGPGRRCYAFLHPMMPSEPLIFVEVALTKGIADSITEVLDHSAERSAGVDADTAIFYSISNCQDGLRGVSLGDFLIKKVAEQLIGDLPNLKAFATLSPIPGFRRWLLKELADESGALEAGELEIVTEALSTDASSAQSAFLALVAADEVPPTSQLESLRPVLMRLATHYLVDVRRGNRAMDPVAHFHLSNGARVEQLNWRANPGAVGWQRGLGMMVNYRYELKKIESNHDNYAVYGKIDRSDAMHKLLVPVSPNG